MQTTQTAASHKLASDAASAAHTTKVADGKESARLRAAANRANNKKKAEQLAATAALLQLNAPLLLPALVVAPLPIPPPPPPSSLAAVKVEPSSQEGEAILGKSNVFARMLDGGPGGEEMALVVTIGQGCNFALTLRGQGINRLASHGAEYAMAFLRP